MRRPAWRRPDRDVDTRTIDVDEDDPRERYRSGDPDLAGTGAGPTPADYVARPIVAARRPKAPDPGAGRRFAARGGGRADGRRAPPTRARQRDPVDDHCARPTPGHSW